MRERVCGCAGACVDVGGCAYVDGLLCVCGWCLRVWVYDMRACGRLKQPGSKIRKTKSALTAEVFIPR